MIKTLWNSLSNIGIKPEYDQKQKKRFTMINQYMVIAILIYSINSISDLVYGYYGEGILLAFSCVVLSLVLFFKKQHHRVSLVLLFIYVSLTIFYFGTLASVQAGDYLYYFPLVLAVCFVFDLERDKGIMIFLFVFITLLLLSHTFTYRSSEEINMVSKTVRYRMFVLNLLISAGTVGFFILLTIRDHKINGQWFEQRLKEKEESEIIIKKTLAEKEVLLQELHHRVKNNLAVIVGYFNLKLNGTENDEAREVLIESRNHVNSMALIHNRLYKTGNFSEVNFTTYLQDLLVEIQESYPSMAESVVVQTRIEEVKLNLNTAVPCALILNELLNNCYKHAFKTIEKGRIHIDLHINKNDELTLSVKDNGVGLKANFDKLDSLGISVINGLSEQLNGKCRFYNDGGTCFTLVFNKN